MHPTGAIPSDGQASALDGGPETHHDAAASSAEHGSGPVLKVHDNCLLESVGFQVPNDFFLVLVHAGSELSTFGGLTLSTVADDQTEFELPVFAGTNSTASRNRSLGTCVISGVPAAPAGQTRIEVRFTACEDGTLGITSRVRGTGWELDVALRE